MAEINPHAQGKIAISDEERLMSKLHAAANEHKPKGKDKNRDKNGKVANDSSCIKPKKWMLIAELFKPCNRKEVFQERNNKQSILVDGDENCNDKDDQMKKSTNALKGAIAKIDKKRNEQKKKSKNDKEHKEEERKSNRLIKELKDDAERVAQCVKNCKKAAFALKLGPKCWLRI